MKQYHIDVDPHELGKTVLLPGDPGRVEKIASFLDDPYPVASKREYVSWNGYRSDKLVTVMSTGIGAPSTAIAVHELAACGVETFIRVGTAGRLSPGTEVGDFAVINSAIRDEGASRGLLPLEVPAVADPFLSMDLYRGLRDFLLEHNEVEDFQRTAHLGMTHSKDLFYGQELAAGSGPLGPVNSQRLKAWQAAGAICSEMEASLIFIQASLLGLKASGLVLLGGDPEGSNVAKLEADRNSDYVLGLAATESLRYVL